MKTFRIFCILIFLTGVSLKHVLGQSKKVNGSILIKNCTVVDVVNRKILHEQNIRIQNGHIQLITDKPISSSSETVIDGTDLIALPGFIDTHTHLWQHIEKSMYPSESLQKWVGIYHAIHCLDSAELYQIVSAACAEALLSGITTVCDYSSLGFNDYAFESNANAIQHAGIGGVLVWNNPSVFLPDSIKLIELKKLSNKYQGQFSIWMGPGPFSFHSIPQVYSGIRIAQQLHMRVTEHTMENMQEQRDFYDSTSSYLKKYGNQLDSLDKSMLHTLLKMKRPSEVDAFEKLMQDRKRILFFDSLLQSNEKAKKLSEGEKQILITLSDDRHISPLPLFEYFNALQDFLAIHAVWLEPADMELAKKYNISVSHNPESNLYLSSGAAPVYEYFRAGIPVSLGTDGAASNDGIDFFSAMKAMWNVYKLKLLNVDISKTFGSWEIIQAATINGARALHIEDRTGSLEVGKDADIVLLSTEGLGMSPFRDASLVPLIIYSADTRNVEYVLSKGRMLVTKGRLTKMNEKKLALDLDFIAKKVDQRILTGKIWSEDITLTAHNFENYWYKFRSIRKPDSVNIMVTNNLKIPIKYTVMASATAFGGGTPLVVAYEVRNRFPFVQDSSFAETFLLQPGEKVTVIKPKEGYDIRILYRSSKMNHRTISGQLLLLAEK